MHIINRIVTMIFILVGSALLYQAVTYTVRAYDIERCQRIVKQAHVGYVGFYITKSEHDTCKARGIIINAPVQ